jgi:hypothetical protein
MHITSLLGWRRSAVYVRRLAVSGTNTEVNMDDARRSSRASVCRRASWVHAGEEAERRRPALDRRLHAAAQRHATQRRRAKAAANPPSKSKAQEHLSIQSNDDELPTVHCGHSSQSSLPLRTQRYQFGALLQKAQIFSGEERTAQEISVWKKR